MSVGHGLVFGRAQVGQQRGHLVEGPPAYGFMIPAITKKHRSKLPRGTSRQPAPPLPHLLLERYWPILSWLFHSRRWRARTLPSLMKDRLWLTESLGGESEAMSKKNLRRREEESRQPGNTHADTESFAGDLERCLQLTSWLRQSCSSQSR